MLSNWADRAGGVPEDADHRVVEEDHVVISHTHIYIYIYIYIYMNKGIYTHTSYVYVYLYICIYIYIHIFIYIYMHNYHANWRTVRAVSPKTPTIES